jgi:tyrosyl-tRNA synthetase
MSKSLDNYVGVAEPPESQFGKLMSISDGLMWRYYELLSAEPRDAVAKLRAACEGGATNPKEAKVALAKEIVARYHHASAADRAAERWDAQFSKREVPEDLPERRVEAPAEGLWLPKALADAGLVKSSSDGRRLVTQGAVQVDGAKVSDPQAKLAAGGRYLVKAGKRAWAYILT